MYLEYGLVFERGVGGARTELYRPSFSVCISIGRALVISFDS